MEPLPTVIQFQGRTLRQVARKGLVALYEVIGAQGFLYGYELIIIKIAPAAEIYGRSYPERQVYPSSAKNSPDWGEIAWSFGRDNKDVAEDCFRYLDIKLNSGGRAPRGSAVSVPEGVKRYSTSPETESLPLS